LFSVADNHSWPHARLAIKYTRVYDFWMSEENTSKRLFAITRGDSFDVDLYDYVTAKGEVEAIRKGFRERRYTPQQLEGPQYRVINYWDEQGILPKSSRDGEDQWRKFTYIEAVWIRVIMRLREFGLPISKILKIKENILEWNEKEGTYLFLEYYFYKAIVNDVDQYVVCLSDGTAILASARELETMKVMTKEQDLLLISLKSLARSMGISTAKSTAPSYLSEGEGDVVSHSRTTRTGEIKAVIKKGKIIGTEATSVEETAERLRKIANEIGANKEFGEIVTKYRDGKKQSFEVKRNKRFK
jgi:DNA-binding transcriptional MerR regulator